MSRRQDSLMAKLIDGFMAMAMWHDGNSPSIHLAIDEMAIWCGYMAGVNFYRFNAKNWHFRQILREKVAFFTDLTRKIGVFRCKFYSPKIVSV